MVHLSIGTKKKKFKMYISLNLRKMITEQIFRYDRYFLFSTVRRVTDPDCHFVTGESSKCYIFQQKLPASPFYYQICINLSNRNS